jgi:hypothetical protein
VAVPDLDRRCVPQPGEPIVGFVVDEGRAEPGLSEQAHEDLDADLIGAVIGNLFVRAVTDSVFKFE